MLHIAFYVLLILAGQSSPAAVACRDWQECRQLALDAADRGDFQQFHDLAWRAVQIGPPKDPALMYLLARAQVLSGRPHDALVMLQRLAQMGVATDAATSDEFERSRQLPGWADVEALIANHGKPLTPVPTGPRTAAPRTPAASRLAPSAASAAPPPATPAPKPFAVASPSASTVARFSAERFTDAGLAYDAVSQRFVVGDARERKLMVVSVDSDHSTDMVRAESAGFQEVAALDIDDRRGDLWVASTTSESSALHRLQLVSGRPLRTYQTASGAGRTAIADLAIASSGAVIALDTAGKRVLTLAREGSELTVAMGLSLPDPTSLTSSADEGILYVAHADGIARVDLRARTATPLGTPRGFDLRRFTRIRLADNALVGLQAAPGGALQLVRLDLSANGRTVTDAAVIDTTVSAAGVRPFIAVSNDALFYLSTDAGTASTAGSGATALQISVRRVRVR